MKLLRALSLLAVCFLLFVHAPLARAGAPMSSPPSGKPSIRIISPVNGAIIHGSTVTIRVAVSHFKLVKPILLEPSKWKTIPLLKGNQGHIHYVLDSAVNMVLTRDVVVLPYHTWTDVSPGPHTLITYLADSQHALFPGTQMQMIHVFVTGSTRRVAAGHARFHTLGVKAMPKTGGGVPEPDSPVSPAAPAGGLLILLLGLGVLARRVFPRRSV
jgi:hypothetical protein